MEALKIWSKFCQNAPMHEIVIPRVDVFRTVFCFCFRFHCPIVHLKKIFAIWWFEICGYFWILVPFLTQSVPTYFIRSRTPRPKSYLIKIHLSTVWSASHVSIAVPPISADTEYVSWSICAAWHFSKTAKIIKNLEIIQNFENIQSPRDRHILGIHALVQNLNKQNWGGKLDKSLFVYCLSVFQLHMH